MFNCIKNFIVPLLMLLAIVSTAPAQTILTPTTLSSAIADSTVQVMAVVSVTTVSGYTVVAGTGAYIDSEYVTIKPLNGAVSGLTVAIVRGQAGTLATPHSSGAIVWFGPPQAFNAKPDPSPLGKCVRASQTYIPYINVKNGVISDCVGGQWVQGVRTPEPQKFLQFPPTGGTAYTSLNTNGTTLGITTVYCTEAVVPYNKLLTGIALLNGTTASTDLHYVVLYDSTGNAVANSAVAGAIAAGTSVYQQYAFTSKFYAVGPAQYFACMQTNGTTDTVRMVVTGTQDTLLTKGQTGATFGTIPALVVPTTFTTAVGPYVYLY